MFVKSLTLKGFKSFASATNLVLEPGITCIVGPNGSGKSNVVDALAWVMGEGSARSLRGGKMDDVIFAGTPGRPALGRAEVTMTIDNTDGALPIDYTEVTISRTMFRGGGSEYAINRTPCRLLDIQELLSDSGIGREMHVIVGQGQLDAVLRATPEERRGFIEEAAGVLKHRRRKEKAVRKLDAMEGNLTRVSDLTAEVRRQLGPLGRQAQTARRAQTIQADVRDARLRLLADDLVQQRAALESELADEAALTARREELEAAVREAGAGLAKLESAAAEQAPVLDRLNSQWYELGSLVERLDAASRLASERARLLESSEHEERDDRRRDPEALRQQAERVRGEELELQAEAEAAQAKVDAAVEARRVAEAEYQAEQQRLVRLARAAADRREGLAKLRGQVEARRSRTEAGRAELGRLRASIGDSSERLTQAQGEIRALELRLKELEEAERPLTANLEQAEAELARLRAERENWRNGLNQANQVTASAQARAEALEMSLGAASVSADDLPVETEGLLGELIGRLTVREGKEAAVSVALGWAAEAFVVESHSAASRLLEELRQTGRGRVALVVADAESPRDVTGDQSASWPELPVGGVWVRDLIEFPPSLDAVMAELTHQLALVPSEQDARAVVKRGGRAVTDSGDVYGPTFVRGGGEPGRSALELRAARDEALAARDQAEQDVRAAQHALSELEAPLRSAEESHDAAADALQENDAELTSTMEQLSRHHQTIAAAGNERDRIENSIQQAEVALEANQAELEELELRLEQAEQEPSETEPSVAERDRLADVVARARTAETEHRLTLRTRQERARALGGRAESLEAAARSEIAARERARAKQARRRAAAEVARAVAQGAEAGREHLIRARERVETLRAAQQEAKRERDAALGQERVRVNELTEALRQVTDTVHRDEVARAQQRLRIEALEQKAAEEFGLDADSLIEEFGPHRDIPVLGEDPSGQDDSDDAAEPRVVPFERAAQEKRLRKAERDLAQLGKVNPLALEEFAALEERHTFLRDQLEDLRRSKQDLLSIVQEVDQRVEEVFTEAYHDVAREFEGVFSRLFPGGEGRLVLTDPENMLTTGLDVEARPPGKKIKRLSLLSGGERSLVAVALLVSIFKARPSPFYIMDEVEAALDDANLGRLITLFEELRDSSQLIVITHQKRTMEVADALYGVTMRGDGITTVVSQRLGELVPRG